jgi:hypothetical protein
MKQTQALFLQEYSSRNVTLVALLCFVLRFSHNVRTRVLLFPQLPNKFWLELHWCCFILNLSVNMQNAPTLRLVARTPIPTCCDLAMKCGESKFKFSLNQAILLNTIFTMCSDATAPKCFSKNTLQSILLLHTSAINTEFSGSVNQDNLFH